MYVFCKKLFQKKNKTFTYYGIFYFIFILFPNCDFQRFNIWSRLLKHNNKCLFGQQFTKPVDKKVT